MRKPIINLEHIAITFYQKKREIEAVKDVSITIDKGEIYGIVGYSGAGKSTLVRTINLLQTPTSGKITIGDDVIFDNGKVQLKGAALRQKRQKIGMIFQHFNLLSQRDVRGNIAFAMEIAGMKRPQIEKRIDELLEIVGLPDRQHNYPSQLSGGQQQRVSIARALAGNPAVILADEPTGALDSHTGREVLGMLQQLHRQGNTVVLITHDNSIAVQAQRIIRLEDGRVVYDGDARAPEAIVQPTLNFEPAEQEGDA